MDGDTFFRRQADECREAAAGASPAESRALLQLARHYEREARTATSAPARRPARLEELNRY
jgi:hypothetical protein